MKVAEREGKYLANLLNKIGETGGGHANSAKEYVYKEPFVYKHLGSMATVGRYKALVDLRQSKVNCMSLHSNPSLLRFLNLVTDLCIINAYVFSGSKRFVFGWVC